MGSTYPYPKRTFPTMTYKHLKEPYRGTLDPIVRLNSKLGPPVGKTLFYSGYYFYFLFIYLFFNHKSGSYR